MPACFRLFPVLLAAFGSSALFAAEFNQVLVDKSSLSFVSRQMGVPVEGRFRTFSAALSFDPARPAAAQARLTLDLASVDAGSREADDELIGKAWFNVKAFPTASFVSSAIRPLAGERFELIGKLTIKGRTQELSAPFTFRQERGHGIFEGTFPLRRLDFLIGEGAWSEVSVVANEVQIKFRFVAAPAASSK
ncbi:MAG: YceI family protein [Candidatus Accumulibacter sp.]|uniref:YceI family protein n=1 Tax=Accumulibacter sp. TaxID=2053492 RepID=UPI002878BB3D|nr:YceI family protein [Accumulibacter sp.]MDS4016495.1 YceI family protein [Accumulibacter sp.]